MARVDDVDVLVRQRADGVGVELRWKIDGSEVRAPLLLSIAATRELAANLMRSASDAEAQVLAQREEPDAHRA